MLKIWHTQNKLFIILYGKYRSSILAVFYLTWAVVYPFTDGAQTALFKDPVRTAL